MDPLSILTGALILGVAAGIKPTAEQAVQDAYQVFKTYLTAHYKVAFNGLEDDPHSKTQQAALLESLQKKKAVEDSEVIRLSEKLLETVRQDADKYDNVQEMIGSNNGVQQAITTARTRQSMFDSEGGRQIIKNPKK